MAISRKRSRRKATGGLYRQLSKKPRNKGGLPVLTGLGKLRKKTVRERWGNVKERLLSIDVANVYDPKAKTYFKAKIETVVENKANRNFVRRNIMTKGAIIKTEKGNARITSRPGQEGSVNAVLV